uniref:Conotoxin superfamily Z n=1 Tax=Conus ermineus TaxID=55423 RepID=A0A346CIU4_CONER|nr:conotoxin precursor superfamily Z [Conus ermineus]
MTPKWGVCIILPVWLVYLPCQTTALHGSQPAPPGRSPRGQCSNMTAIKTATRCPPHFRRSCVCRL